MHLNLTFKKTTLYSAIEPWVIGAKTSFEVFHGVTDPKISALLSAMISIVPIPLGPILGLMVDAVKGNAWWCLTGSLLSIFGHLALATHIFSASLTAPFWLLLFGNILIGLGYTVVLQKMSSRGSTMFWNCSKVQNWSKFSSFWPKIT